MNFSLLQRQLSIVARVSRATRSIATLRHPAIIVRHFSTTQSNPQEKTDDNTYENLEISEEQKLADDNYNKAARELETSQQLVKDLHHQLLLKYANAENTRRERVAEIKRRGDKHISQFGEKIGSIYESLAKVCATAQTRSSAPDATDKVKAFTEGLTMTQGIFKNVLEKHNIAMKKSSE